MKRCMIMVLICVFCQMSAVCRAAGTGAEDLIGSYKKETRCTDVSAVVYADGTEEHLGSADSLYQIGSMTKAFTGLAVQELIHEGRVSETEDISAYIPGFTAYHGGELVRITTYDLMTQRSGYTNDERAYPSAADGMTLTDWAMTISGRELMSAPGDRYEYSNVNYDLLGAVIENVTGMTYADYMQGAVLTPLGLTSTCSVNDADADRTIHGTRIGYRIPFTYDIPIAEARVPAGYLCSDTADMGRWLAVWIGDADIPDDLRACIDDIKAHLKEEGDYYAGWERRADGVIGHSGGTANFSSRIVFSEKDHAGACVLTNINAAASTDSLCDGILDVTRGREPQGIRTDIWTVFDITFTIASAVCAVLITATALSGRTFAAVTGASAAVLFAAVMIVFPAVFGASMTDIVFVWAPWSVGGCLLMMIGAFIAAEIRIWGLRYGYNKKTGARQAADGDDRIP